MSHAVVQGEIITELIKESGHFPNNNHLPVIIYRTAVKLDKKEISFEDVFTDHGWQNCWRNGIYDYHHYHSTAHEVLGILSGKVTIQLGGPNGPAFKLAKGDAVVLPAGMAHKNLGSSSDFICVGAYPEGQDYDMNYGEASERLNTDENISRVPLPSTDPLYGHHGPLLTAWKRG